MKSWWPSGCFARSAAQCLGRGVLLLAMLCLAITPQGFMPGVDRDGAATFVICTPEGVVEREIPGILDPFRAPPVDERATGMACPFAIVADLAVTDYFGGLPQIAFARADAPGLPYLSPALRRLRDRPGVRAPPVLFL